MYNVNILFDSYTSSYILGNNETIIVPNDIKSFNDLRLKIKDLMGYFPSTDYIRSWVDSDPWIYIERTANNSSEINVIYTFDSYSYQDQVLKIKRNYAGIGEVDGKQQICYDLVQIKGFNLFSVYNIPSNLKIIIIEE